VAKKNLFGEDSKLKLGCYKIPLSGEDRGGLFFREKNHQI
jgi:hypothetical protein